MKKKKEKVVYVDDGRTIANMNVEGMPWYNPVKKNPSEQKDTELYSPSAKETLSIMGGVLKAAMLVALVFVAVFALFICFCYFIWFK